MYNEARTNVDAQNQSTSVSILAVKPNVPHSSNTLRVQVYKLTLRIAKKSSSKVVVMVKYQKLPRGNGATASSQTTTS